MRGVSSLLPNITTFSTSSEVQLKVGQKRIPRRFLTWIHQKSKKVQNFQVTIVRSLPVLCELNYFECFFFINMTCIFFALIHCFNFLEQYSFFPFLFSFFHFCFHFSINYKLLSKFLEFFIFLPNLNKVFLKYKL